MDNATADALSLPLNRLQVEQEFAMPIPVVHDNGSDECLLKWGRLLYVGLGSSLVEFVEDERLVQVRISSDTLVIPDE